jgi:hypothetical protein
VDKAWPSLSEEERSTIVSELLGYVSQLAKIRGTFIGSIDNTPLCDKCLYNRPTDTLPTVSVFTTCWSPKSSLIYPPDLRVSHRDWESGWGPRISELFPRCYHIERILYSSVYRHMNV